MSSREISSPVPVAVGDVTALCSENDESAGSRRRACVEASAMVRLNSPVLTRMEMRSDVFGRYCGDGVEERPAKNNWNPDSHGRSVTRSERGKIENSVSAYSFSGEEPVIR